MAGSLSLSMSQQFDQSGNPLIGGLVYFFQANTSIPQSAYQDTGLSLPWPNPLPLVGAGRVPEFYLANGNIHIRLTDKNGVVQLESLNALVIGPSSGSGGGTSVDPTTIFQTGDVMWSEIQGTRSGWVRDNGFTIGSAVSGATERANADTQNLFVYLWNNFPNLTVTGGRGASGLSDFNANKLITLPDKRGYIPGGLDDMGNVAAGRYTNVPFASGNATTAGSRAGEATHALAVTELPIFTPSGTINANTPLWSGPATRSQTAVTTNGNPRYDYWSGSSEASCDNWVAPTFVGNSIGGGGAHNNTPLVVLGTFFRKL